MGLGSSSSTFDGVAQAPKPIKGNAQKSHSVTSLPYPKIPLQSKCRTFSSSLMGEVVWKYRDGKVC